MAVGIDVGVLVPEDVVLEGVGVGDGRPIPLALVLGGGGVGCTVPSPWASCPTVLVFSVFTPVWSKSIRRDIESSWLWFSELVHAASDVWLANSMAAITATDGYGGES